MQPCAVHLNGLSQNLSFPANPPLRALTLDPRNLASKIDSGGGPAESRAPEFTKRSLGGGPTVCGTPRPVLVSCVTPSKKSLGGRPVVSGAPRLPLVSHKAPNQRLTVRKEGGPVVCRDPPLADGASIRYPAAAFPHLPLLNALESCNVI